VRNEQKRTPLRAVVRALGYTLICLPILASFLYVREFGVNVPLTDTWVMAPLFEKLFSGELGLGDLWAQHSEHRPLLPRIFLLLMGPLADFNIVTIMYAIQLCLLATFVCVFLAYRDTVGLEGKSLFFAAPLSLLVFSLGQYWNMFHAWSIHVVVVVPFGILSFLLLSKLRDKGNRMKILLFLASILSGSAATLSAGHGLLVWPVGLMQLSLEPILGGRKKYLLIVWTLTGCVHWAVYFWGFKATQGRMSNVYFYNDSTLGVSSFFGLIGSALFQEPVLAIATGLVIGAILVLVVFWIWKNREQNRYTFWISLSAFSLLILAATTAARSGRGLDAINPSKYVTFAVLLTIGAYVMSLQLARDHSGLEFSALPLGVCAGLIVLSAPLSYYAAVEKAETIRMHSERAAFILATYKIRTNACLEQAVRPHFWQPNITAKDGAAIFDGLNYTVFSEPRSEITRGNIAIKCGRHSRT
jgi:hypothetical protein